MINYGWLVLWVHVLSLEAMFDDEMRPYLDKIMNDITPMGNTLMVGPLTDERWWRMRWIQENVAVAEEARR